MQANKLYFKSRKGTHFNAQKVNILVALVNAYINECRVACKQKSTHKKYVKISTEDFNRLDNEVYLFDAIVMHKKPRLIDRILTSGKRFRTLPLYIDIAQGQPDIYLQSEG